MYMIFVLPEEFRDAGLDVVAINIQPIEVWDDYSPDHDGIAGCTHVARVIFTAEDSSRYYDGIDIPLEPSRRRGGLVMAGWFELDTPDLQGADMEKAMDWLRKLG
jgi:hypothetical protein